MWGGDKIIGFGEYHYRYDSGREGNWPATGFSPGSQNISIYVMPGFSKYDGLMQKLDRYSPFKKLEDLHLPTLKRPIKRGYADIKKMYP